MKGHAKRKWLNHFPQRAHQQVCNVAKMGQMECSNTRQDWCVRLTFYLHHSSCIDCQVPLLCLTELEMFITATLLLRCQVPPSSCIMLASAVSSAALGAMAAAEGFRFEQTLTGFKWLGNVAKQKQAQGLTVLFAFEEAIGFMFPATNMVSTLPVLGS
eukprot:GHRQ01030340.1.p1 GENE.GHRQ01030340.1~~GHRQ01030340.1.p1  ORF type:complete len:158 (-),score=32.05 GHRQ01030340.1:111-584(-)